MYFSVLHLQMLWFNLFFSMVSVFRTVHMSTLVFLIVNSLHILRKKTKKKKTLTLIFQLQSALRAVRMLLKLSSALNSAPFQLQHETSAPQHKNNKMYYCYITEKKVCEQWTYFQIMLHSIHLVMQETFTKKHSSLSNWPQHDTEMLFSLLLR